jgi:hypothetical protein
MFPWKLVDFEIILQIFHIKKNSSILMKSVSEYFLQTKICPFLRPDIYIINRNVTDHVVPWIIIIVRLKIKKYMNGSPILERHNI